jgi:hypothetical protein
MIAYRATPLQNSKKRRPTLEILIDLISLEKTGEFPELSTSFFNGVYGLHLVVLYVIIDQQRFPWAIRIWRGAGEKT